MTNQIKMNEPLPVDIWVDKDAVDTRRTIEQYLDEIRGFVKAQSVSISSDVEPPKVIILCVFCYSF